MTQDFRTFDWPSSICGLEFMAKQSIITK